jgi:RNA polymerase sigma factor (TIGR02999 family)
MEAMMTPPAAVLEVDAPAAEALFTDLYSELHRMARRELARHGSYASLGPSTLLHEAYLDMSARKGMVFPDRARFMAYATRAMRGLIIDHIRRQHAHKRGGLLAMTSLDKALAEQVTDAAELQDISDALDDLATIDGPLAEIVDLKFFCGFSFGEIATMRGMSERTVQRHWEKARIYLHQRIGGTSALPQARAS